jgi:hypothetical protein
MALLIGLIYIIKPKSSKTVDSCNVISDPISIRLLENFGFDDIQTQILRVTEFEREIVALRYRKPYINSNGMPLYEEIRICNDEDVREMFDNYLNFINLWPLELYVSLRRTADEIVSLCKSEN